MRDCPRRAQTKGCCKKHYDQVATGRIPSPEGVDIPLRPKCDFPDCRNLQFSLKKGLCKSHIYQLLQGRELSPLRDYGVYESGQKKCSIRDCKNFATGRTMCQKHLSRANQYGLTAAELDDLLAIGECQNPGCSETKNLHIDHDHDTGKVRGVLCSSCNTTLGHMKENVERIRGLAEYKLMHS
ncbi:endonuclease VII domain-containing protein [Pseudanabaena phage Pan2]|nr:endonuclease VII domain-containing protein [Pseudanabaena phage Pan2]